MKKVLLLLVSISTFACAQGNIRSNIFTVTPTPTLTGVGEMRLQELSNSASAHYVGFKPPNSISANIIWTLPSADGSSSQVLQTNGSGILSWVSAPTPAIPITFSGSSASPILTITQSGVGLGLSSSGPDSFFGIVNFNGAVTFNSTGIFNSSLTANAGITGGVTSAFPTAFFTNGGTGPAVRGTSFSATGPALEAINSAGGIGLHIFTGTGPALFAEAVSGGLAGHFGSGNVQIDGNLLVSGTCTGCSSGLTSFNTRTGPAITFLASDITSAAQDIQTTASPTFASLTSSADITATTFFKCNASGAGIGNACIKSNIGTFYIDGDGNFAGQMASFSNLVTLSRYGTSNQVNVRRANGSFGSETAILNTNLIGALSITGYDGTVYSGPAGRISVNATENWNSGAHGVDMTFAVTPNGSTTLTSAVNISNAGVFTIFQLAGAGNLPACLTPGGAVYAGSNTAGVLSCP